MHEAALPAEELHFGAYTGTVDDLTLVATGQRLCLKRRRGKCLYFVYSDHEVEVAFRVNEHSYKMPRADEASTVLQAGFGPRNAKRLMAEYGLWRRVSWFLIEALLVRLGIEHKSKNFSEIGVELNGGWLSDGWSDRVKMTQHAFNLHENMRLTGMQPNASLTPRDTPPLSARLIDGRSPTASLTREMVAEADAIKLRALLKQVPRYEFSDGSCLFFSEVMPHSGPEYSPSQQSGMILGGAMIFVSHGHGSIWGPPLALSGNEERLTRPSLANVYLFGRQDTNVSEYPAEWLIEHQFYARLAAAEVTQAVAYDDCPRMVHPDYDDQAVSFCISQASSGYSPFAIGLGNGPRGTVLNQGVQNHPDALAGLPSQIARSFSKIIGKV